MEKLNLEGFVTATEFAKLTGCTKGRVNQWMDPKESKLTEMTDKNPSGSFKKVGYNTMIHIENAKVELRSKLRARSNKNPLLFAFLGMDEEEVMIAVSGRREEIDKMRPDKVIDELNKVELLTKEFKLQVLEGKYWEKTAVAFHLHSIGVAHKTIMEGIAPRYISQIRAAASDREAENILHKAMEDAMLQINAELEKDISKK